MNADRESWTKRYLFGDPLPPREAPTATILMGGVASGKTTLRRTRYSHNAVLIDAAQVFLDCGLDDDEDFPGRYAADIDKIGSIICRFAIKERLNIITEIIGDDFASTTFLIDALKSAGYKVNVIGVECDLDVSIQRSKDRSEPFISAYYAGPINARWIVEAINFAGNKT